MTRIISAFLTLILFLTLTPPIHATTTWYDSALPYRLEITVSDTAIGGQHIFVPLNPDTSTISSLNLTTITADQLRLTDHQSSPIPFFYGPQSPTMPTKGIHFLNSIQPGSPTSTYHLYFGQPTDQPTTPVPPTSTAITIQNLPNYQGQLTTKITTSTTEYYYHMKGAGFASLIDADGNDWISYSTANGAAGEYRGIPNMGFNPGEPGYMHPGMEVSSTQITADTGFMVTLYSTANDGNWAGYWDIFPTYARFTLTQASHNFWFLYEGTPGGQFDTADTVTRSNGTTTLVTQNWSADIPDPEWIYFSDPDVNQSLFLINLTDDNVVDSYKFMGSAPQQMTVFGFGRQATGTNQQMTPATLPRSFIIGLATPGQTTLPTYLDALAQPPTIQTKLETQSQTPTLTANPLLQSLAQYTNILTFLNRF